MGTLTGANVYAVISTIINGEDNRTEVIGIFERNEDAKNALVERIKIDFQSVFDDMEVDWNDEDEEMYGSVAEKFNDWMDDKWRSSDIWSYWDDWNEESSVYQIVRCAIK